MARLETPNFFAMDEAPLTSKSAPLIRIAKPTSKRRDCKTIDQAKL
jgi:hypothetical protein